MFLAKRCIRAFSSMKDLVLKKEWYKAYTQLEKERKIEDPDLITSLAWGLSNIGRHDEAYKLVQMMPSLGKEPSELEYTAALEASIKQKNLDMATNLFYQAKVYGISFDAALYDFFIGSLCKDLGIRNLKSIIDYMKKDGCTPSIYTCVNLMKIGHELNDRDFVNEIANVAKQAEYSIPKKMIEKYTKPLPESKTSKKIQEKEKKIEAEGENLQNLEELDKELRLKYSDRGAIIDPRLNAGDFEEVFDEEDFNEEDLEGEEEETDYETGESTDSSSDSE
ncbi:unnamed protein product [Blepharisma stoltei]|uniref:Pentatricopeptide repeat-containing protein n=1 Tax=Blepharisma stoltei TaxID=1481888 RepID=A0AAU9ID94_9CILI|nr:unnamed protein product [Blepharisma stoltei]